MCKDEYCVEAGGGEASRSAGQHCDGGGGGDGPGRYADPRGGRQEAHRGPAEAGHKGHGAGTRAERRGAIGR